MVKNTPDLPDELWLHIVSHFSVADQLADFNPPVASYITIGDENRVISESKEEASALYDEEEIETTIQTNLD